MPEKWCVYYCYIIIILCLIIIDCEKKFATVRVLLLLLLCREQLRPASIFGGENKTGSDRNSGGGRSNSSRQKVRKHWNVCSGIETNGYCVALNKIKIYREKRWRRWCRWIGDEFGQVEIRYRDTHTRARII